MENLEFNWAYTTTLFTNDGRRNTPGVGDAVRVRWLAWAAPAMEEGWSYHSNRRGKRPICMRVPKERGAREPLLLCNQLSQAEYCRSRGDQGQRAKILT